MTMQKGAEKKEKKGAGAQTPKKREEEEKKEKERNLPTRSGKKKEGRHLIYSSGVKNSPFIQGEKGKESIHLSL